MVAGTSAEAGRAGRWPGNTPGAEANAKVTRLNRVRIDPGAIRRIIPLAQGALDVVAAATRGADAGRAGPCQILHVRRFRDSELGLAVDVFLSFALVAIVIAFGLLLRVPAWALPIWNLAVVLNVLGAGAGRLFVALRRPATV